MSDLTLQGYRTKAVPQAPLLVSLVSSGTEHNDLTDSTVEYIRLESAAPVPATIPILTDVSTTLDNAIITGNFSSYDLRPGDLLEGVGISFGSKIAAVINTTTISLDQNCTITGTATDVVVTPPTFDSNLFSITKNFTMSGSTLSMRVKVLRADGRLNKDTNGDNIDDSTYLDYKTYIDQTIQVDLDSYLSNLRISRN